jgi:nucleotide-binding universal stress UspA family protein
MKRIIIGTEGSSDAMKAVEGGLELASELGASVTFVCVRTPPAPLLGEPFYQRELDAEMAHAREVVDEAMSLAAAADVDADYEILDGGASDAILRVAATHDADLIVVGSRGHGAVQSAIFGSVSKELISHAHRPVLVVKDALGSEPQRNVPLVNNGAVLS